MIDVARTAPELVGSTSTAADSGEMARVGDAIARLSAHLTAATYRLLVLTRIFDEGEGWHEEGFTSCAAWLSWKTGIGPGTATPRWDGEPMDTDWALGALRGDRWPAGEEPAGGAWRAAGPGP